MVDTKPLIDPLNRWAGFQEREKYGTDGCLKPAVKQRKAKKKEVRDVRKIGAV